MAPEHVPSCFSWSVIFMRKLDASNLLSHTIFAMSFVKWSIEKNNVFAQGQAILCERRANCTENIKYCYHFVMEGFIRYISFNLVVHNNKLHSSFHWIPLFSSVQLRKQHHANQWNAWAYWFVDGICAIEMCLIKTLCVWNVDASVLKAWLGNYRKHCSANDFDIVWRRKLEFTVKPLISLHWRFGLNNFAWIYRMPSTIHL